MKKLLLAVLMLAMSATYASAAGSCVEVINGMYEPDKVKITLSCTSHTDNSLSTVLSAASVRMVEGWYLYKVGAYPGGTAPTTDTDLTITATKTGTNKSIDILGTNGTDIIDNTETREEVPRLTAGAINFYPLMDTDNIYTIATANNTVASATFFLELIFVK